MLFCWRFRKCLRMFTTFIEFQVVLKFCSGVFCKFQRLRGFRGVGIFGVVYKREFREVLNLKVQLL